MKDKSFLDELREAIVMGSEHEIYFRDEAGGTVLLYYDISDKDLRNQISRCLWVNGASIQMYAERQGISFEAAREKIRAQHAAIVEELAGEKRGQLKELIEDTVRQAIYDFWLEVRGEAQEKSIVRQPGDVWRFTRKGIVKLRYKRGIVEKKSTGHAGAPAGKRRPHRREEPKDKDDFYRRLKKFAISYMNSDNTIRKRPPAPIAAARLGFGSSRTMMRRLAEWGDDRSWNEIIDGVSK